MREISRLCFLALLGFAISIASFCFRAEGAGKSVYLVYVGTYTRQQSKGIYAFRFDAGTGKAAAPVLAAEAENPSFLAVHPSRNYLYAVNEIGNFAGQKAGSISAYGVDRKTGLLNFLGKVSSRGDSPCHIALDKAGTALFAANYGAGSVAWMRISKDGSLSEATGVVQHTGRGVNPQRQQGPHAHEAVVSPDGPFVLVPDLGLDKVLVYRWDRAAGSLIPAAVPIARLAPGSGPRHLAFGSGGRFVYVVNELFSTVTVFGFDPKSGALAEVQTVSALPKDFSGVSTCAEIAARPDGKFLYVSNRGHDSIAVFAIDREKGTLALSAHVPTQGKSPRHFAIDPTGSWLFAANQGSGNVVIFHIDAASGNLIPSGEVLDVPSPVCVVFLLYMPS